MPFFICPNCGNRELSGERTVGFSNRPKGCSKCGFGFLFELLDDYYPAPGAAFFTCDKDGRLLDLGKKVAVNAEGDLPTEAVADVFPAYDDDGGLLLVLTPE